MEFRIEHHDGFFEMILTGKAKPETFQALFESLLAHEEWKSGAPLLVDETALDASDLSVNDVRTIGTHCIDRAPEFGPSRCAIFVSRDLEYGLNRMWGAFVEEKWEVTPAWFRSREEALDWLGVWSET